MKRLFFFLSILLIGCTGGERNDGPRRLEIFFLGDNRKQHDAEQMAEILSQEFFPDAINITYSADPEDLAREELGQYDGLILYANHDTISDSQAKGLLDFVASGKGFVPLHSGSFCFRNNPEVVSLIGGMFKSHGEGSFSAGILESEHPAMQGVWPFTTEWDETYVHERLANDIVVLMERVDSTGREPYAWVKEYGRGRVFYTAFGHDARTFKNPGFIQLVKSGLLWAVGDEAVARKTGFTVAEPKYESAKMPNYERRDPPPRYQLPLSPEESQTLIQVPVGFRLELFASEPDIKKPIAMEWDEKGRLWIVETVDYPNSVRNDKSEGDDRIVICEDTDEDGKADKFTVFAEHLNIPTGFVFANGGVIVAQAPHFLFIKDEDGDDKADVQEVLMEGWGTSDTHAGPSSLHYAMDNKIWGTVGYAGFDGNVGGHAHRFGNAVFRFDQQGKQMELLGGTSNNTWGLGFSEEFDVFASTANNEHSDFFAIPARYYERAGLAERGIEKIDSHYGIHVLTKDLRQVDVHGGFTAAAGHSLYTARAFPKTYWNRVAFIAEPTGRLVHRHILEQVGSGFREKGDGWNMVASSDNWFGPVVAKVGPDGALWISDWYNFIIQHNPTPHGFENGAGNAYIDPLRDNQRGRIYRLVHEDAKPGKPMALAADKTKTLINGLKSDNLFWRTTAQRLLVERGDINVAKELHQLIRNQAVDEININGAAMHAIWTVHGLGLLGGQANESLRVVIGALKHPAPGVRKAAIQTLPMQLPEAADSLMSAGVIDDADLRVRLAALLALSEAAPSERVGKAVFDAVEKRENVDDKWVAHGLLIAGSVHRGGFLKSYLAKYGSPSLSNTDGTLADRLFAGSRMKLIPLVFDSMLEGRQVPDLGDREFTFFADVKEVGGSGALKEGVMIAQGDDKEGYVVYVRDGRVYFQINQRGRAAIIHSTAVLPASFSVKASLLANGRMVLSIDGNEVATGKAIGLFKQTPGNFIRIGHNRKLHWWDPATPQTTNVGNYLDDFHFSGKFENARLIVINPVGDTTVQHVPVDEEIIIKAVVGEMKYDVTSFEVKPGKKLKIVFQNPDHMQHNFLILNPGTLATVGLAADQLAKQSNAIDMQYVPTSADVLFSTPLVNPNETTELVITVPHAVGDYPYVCTFPGHWRMMNGIMMVRK